MNVNECLRLNNFTEHPVEITGYLVLVDDKLTLIDFDDANNFKTANGIEIGEQAIRYVLQEVLLPLGGESSIFHKTELVGIIDFTSAPVIQVQKIKVQEKGNKNWMDVDLDDEYVELCSSKHMPNAGFDFFKEMGD